MIIDLPLELIDLICNFINLERLEEISEFSVLKTLNRTRIEKYWRKIGIHELVKLGKLQGVKHLYDNNIDYSINLVFNHPLREACIHGKIDIVKYLVKKGANIRMFYDSPLMCAITHNHIQIVKYLVKKGASISDNRGNIFYWYINSLEILKYIMTFEPDMIYKETGSLLRASEKGDFEMVKYIVNLFIVKNDIENVKNIPGIEKCIKSADVRGHTEIVQYFTGFGIFVKN
jgi:ankyrin repeat protein